MFGRLFGDENEQHFAVNRSIAIAFYIAFRINSQSDLTSLVFGPKWTNSDSFVLSSSCDWKKNAGWPRLSSLHCKRKVFTVHESSSVVRTPNSEFLWQKCIIGFPTNGWRKAIGYTAVSTFCCCSVVWLDHLNDFGSSKLDSHGKFFISEDVRVDPYSQAEGIRKLTCLAGLAVANQDTDVLFLITNI